MPSTTLEWQLITRLPLCLIKQQAKSLTQIRLKVSQFRG